MKKKNSKVVLSATSLNGKRNKIKAFEYDMSGHAQQCVERYCELADIKETTLKHAETPCIDDHQLQPHMFEEKGKLEPVAARIVLKILYLARMGRADLFWSVNSLAREAVW